MIDDQHYFLLRNLIVSLPWINPGATNEANWRHADCEGLRALKNKIFVSFTRVANIPEVT